MVYYTDIPNEPICKTFNLYSIISDVSFLLNFFFFRHFSVVKMTTNIHNYNIAILNRITSYQRSDEQYYYVSLYDGYAAKGRQREDHNIIGTIFFRSIEELQYTWRRRCSVCFGLLYYVVDKYTWISKYYIIMHVMWWSFFHYYFLISFLEPLAY